MQYIYEKEINHYKRKKKRFKNIPFSRIKTEINLEVVYITFIQKV